jgi:hypothetical protein
MTLPRARLHVGVAVALALALGFLAGGCGGLDPTNPAAGGGGGGGTPLTPGAYGVPVQGFPSWHERVLLVLTNAVRMGPLDWRTRYAADFSPSLASARALEAYPAVGPIRWNAGLAQAARAHSEDMARTPCFSHDSCDGTSWATRIRSYYSLSGSIGENIAAGPSDPRHAMNLWLCDASGGSCCADGASCDGHRRNMMNGGWRALGTGHGYVSGAPYGHYWTQDFGGASDLAEPPLVDGSHLAVGAETVFLANWSAAAPPRSIAVVVDGAATPLALDLGTAARGTWSARTPRGTACRSYHLQAVDVDGGSWRVPATGEYRTFGEGSCAEDYRP